MLNNISWKTMQSRHNPYLLSSPRNEYQEEVLSFSEHLLFAGQWVFYGGGKTFLSLATLAQKHANGEQVFPCIIACPANLIQSVWMEQIKEHTTFSAVAVTGTADQRRRKLDIPAQIYVMNYDIGRSGVRGKIQLAPWRSLIVDECKALANWRTPRWIFWKLISKKVRYRIFLSGRPLTERPEELYGQVTLLDLGKAYGTSFWKWRDYYFTDYDPRLPARAQNKYEWKLKDGAAEELTNRIAGFTIYVPKSEVLKQLPPRTFNVVRLPLDKKLRAAYDHLLRENELIWNGTRLWESLHNVASQQKLLQFCQGVVYTSAPAEAEEDSGNPDNVKRIHDIKARWLEDNIKEIVANGPVLVWTPVRGAIDLYIDVLIRLGISFRAYHGGQSLDTRAGLVRDFQKEKFEVFILSEHAAYRGLNLQVARNAIFMGNANSNDMRENALDRNHRLGSEIHETVDYTDVLIADSIDTVIYDALHKKQSVTGEVYKYLETNQRGATP